MTNSNSTNSQGSPHPAAPPEKGPTLWQRLKSSRLSYLTLPLLAVATLVEFVILATGYKYQQAVCLPQGMGVTFFGIGPIGATILAVELLKLPLAIWTASRVGWTKGFMLFAGLPLICILTFQLVKDMAVYEMGTAMAPAGQLLEKGVAEETKIAQLKGDLAAIEQKKVNRGQMLAELAAKQAKAKADLEESLKRNEGVRQEGISLSEYQKKELSEVEIRQAAITKQFDADAAQITKTIADLRARRETELGRASQWNADDARIENDYKAKLAEYTNRKTAYEKDKAEYAAANFLKRQLMKEPVDPGVPPARETSKILKPALLAELDSQIKAKEDELLTVNNKRRDRVAQVDADARRVREEFDRRSSTKRDETDRKHEELLAAQAALVAELKAEESQVNQEFQAAAKKVDGIRAEIDAAQKKAEGYFEAREASIRNTQVHRIATTVEIVRGLVMGERPMSIKATAKERGDIMTDQISMVRIWVYPVLAFIVAFLPTLMVEVGISTLFKPETQRPPHRLGFLGRGLHALYIRAGRQKILRAERMAREVSAEIAARDAALAQKEVELQGAREAIAAASAQHEERSEKLEDQREAELRQKESEWVAKLANMADSLNRAIVEKDTLRDLQKSEIERQVQMRQNAWSDRLTQLRQELDDQRAASEAERTALLEEHHEKLMEVSEECKTQVLQARRQIATAELATVELSSRLAHDLKEALNARDAAVSQLQQQTETFSLKLSQTQEDAARAMEKATRQEKHRSELQQLEFAKTLRQRDDDFAHQFQQREQEQSLAFDARLAEEKHKIEQDSRRREAELERQFEARALEVEARWNQEVKQREEATQIRLKQREQQLQAQAELRVSDLQTQAEQEARRQKLEFERQLDAQSREAAARLNEELQKKELAFHGRLKQREQELAIKAADRETALQNQWTADLSAREEVWEKQAESRVRAAEARLGHEAQQKEEVFQMKIRQHEQELQAQLDARQAELKAQWDQALLEREQEWERDAQASARATESRWKAELQQQEELLQSKSRQRDQQWQTKLDATRAELQSQTEQVLRRREAEAEASLREVETRLRKEMQEKEEAAQAEASQREQELVSRLTAQAEARLVSAEAQWQKQWQSEAEEKVRAATSPLRAQLARTEKERDEAVASASGAVNQAQDMERKLTEASSFLNGWKNGKHLIAAGR